MTAILSHAQYVINEKGKRTHVMVPIELFDQLLQKQQPPQECESDSPVLNRSTDATHYNGLCAG